MRWLLRLLSLVLVLVATAVAALFVLPTERIASLATDRFEAATGRTLEVKGAVRPALWPVLGVTANAVEIGNPDWAGAEPWIEAERMAIGIDPRTLFSDIEITAIEIDSPVVRLIDDGGGRQNWVFDTGGNAGDSAGDSATAARLPAIAAIRVRDGTVIYRPADKAEIRVEALDIDAAFPDAAGPADLSVSGRSGAAQIALEARIDRLADWMAGADVPLRAEIGLGGASATFEGSGARAPLSVAGRLAAEAAGLADLFAALGLPAPDLPTGLGRNRIEVATTVGLAENRVALDGFVARLDGNRIDGRAEIALGGARPVVDADLDLGAFDLSAAATGGGATTGTGGAVTGWSRAPIDMSALSLLDGQIAVRASSMALGTARIDGLTTRTVIDNARAETEIVSLRAYDGSASGQLVLNARNGFSTRLDIAGSAFAIARLLEELVGYDRIVAAGDLRLNVLGVGNSMDALMNSLDGEGAFRVGAGELIGLDIAGMLRTLDPSYIGEGYTTIFDEISGSFRIIDGVVVNDDLRLTAPLFRATGSGQIGIGGQTLDLRVIPELLGGDNAGIRVPILITGDWDNPRLRLDLEGAIRTRVEDELRERVEEAEEDVRDRIEDRLEDAVREGLGRLFDR
jgi:AsmA protein